MNILAARLGTTVTNLRTIKAVYEPEPTFPDFLVPRPTKLSQEEMNAVKYYKNLRNKILEETPFYITGKKRAAEDDDDGIKRYRDKYKPTKSHRQTLRGLTTDESFFPDELKPILQGGKSASARGTQKKYNLDQFLEVANEDDIPELTEEEPTGPNRADIIRNEDDDELEPALQDPDADEDLDEDDYGEDYFDNGEGDHDDYVDDDD